MKAKNIDRTANKIDVIFSLLDSARAEISLAGSPCNRLRNLKSLSILFDLINREAH